MHFQKIFDQRGCSLALAFLSTAALAQAVKPAPAGGRSMLAADWTQGFTLMNDASAVATMKRVVVAGESFDAALELETTGAPLNSYSNQLHKSITVPVSKGDTLYATFYARCERAMAGGAFVEFVFEKGSPDWEKSIVFPVSAREQWTQFQIPFTAADDYAADAAQVVFRVGYASQIVQIADVHVVDYGKQVAVADLPVTKTTYPGREPDAAWRAAADKRIDRIRKADLTVHVRDAAGKPVAGATVVIAQQRQAFGFGSAVTADALANNDPGLQQYRDHVAKLFSEVVFENDMKWGAVQNGSVKIVMPALQWLADHGIRARGHNLVWPSYRFLPKSIKDIAADPAKLAEVVDQHVTSTAALYKGKVVDWDVLNEPFNNHDLMDILGKWSMVKWFQLAHAADPAAKLYMNDWGLTEGGGHAQAHQDFDFDLMKYLIGQGAPIDGIGLQSHFDMALTAPDRVFDILDRYATLGKRIKITEFDVTVAEPQLQADYLRDYITICFSHPAVDGILMWGFWEKKHWLPKAALYNADWSPRPAATAYEDLVLKKWWTNETLKTDASGNVTTRGFLGDYAISVGGRKTSLQLTKAGASITLGN